MQNYNGVYIEKITKLKNVFIEHTYDKRRKFFERTIFKIEFDNGNTLYLKMKPKKYQNCFNRIDFKIIDTKFTRKKVIYDEII